MRGMIGKAPSWSPSASAKLMTLAALFVSVATGSATALGGGLSSTLAAADAGIADMIHARSPGARGPTEMIKGRAVPAPAIDRVARALPRLREVSPAAAAAIPPAAPGGVLVGPAVAEAAPVPGAPGAVLLAGPAGPGGGFFFPGPGGLVAGIGGGGGGGGGVLIPPGETPVATPTPTPVAGVPEPATWLTLILGFGIIGTGLRARRTGARHRA